MTGAVLSDIAQEKCTRLKNTIMHYVGRTHPLEMMCAPANLETSCLPEISDVSRKLRLLCSCQFLWCALAVRFDANKLECALGPENKRDNFGNQIRQFPSPRILRLTIESSLNQ
jgi:hypothetical protein